MERTIGISGDGAPRPVRWAPSQLLLVCALLAGPAALVTLWAFPQLDSVLLHSTLGHVLIAGETALLGVGLALLVLRVAYRSRDGRLFLIGMGFLATASLFFVNFHLSSLDALTFSRATTHWSATISLVLGGVLFALSGLDLSREANERLMRHAGGWLAIFLVFWLVHSWMYLVLSPAISADALAQPAWSSAVRSGLMACGTGCYVFAVVRHMRLYRQRPSQAGLAITCGIALLGEALLTQQMAPLYSLSFWLHHVLQAAAFTVISLAVLRAYHRGLSDEGLLESLLLAVTRLRLRNDYAGAIDALLGTLERGEPLTAAVHNRLQQQFGLTESQLLVVERTAQIVAGERQQRHTLERLNSTLLEVERKKEQLVRMIVHDLKNPLTAQVGFLEMLRMVGLNEAQAPLVDGALRSGQTMAGLVDDLLDVAQLEGGTLHLQRTPLSAADLLSACAQELQPWGAVERKTIEHRVEPGAPIAEVDVRLMRRVVINLLSNAIKHTPEGTRILLRAAGAQAEGPSGELREMLAIEVEDSGPGIPPEQIERLFDRFGVPRAGGSRRQSNSGIGLSFCRLAVEAHGGMIEVASAVGSGTTFRVVLPLR